MSARKAQKERVIKQKFSMQLMYKQRYLLLMSLPFVIWLIIFKYIPLWGWTMAFQDVRPKNLSKHIWERPFAGLDNFVKAFSDADQYHRVKYLGDRGGNGYGNSVRADVK